MRLSAASLLANLLALGLASACVSSSPRAFVADIQPPPPERTSFDALFLGCADEVGAGRRESFQTGQVDPGPATNAVAATAGATLIYAGASAGWSGIGAIGVGSSMIMLAPVASVGVASAVRYSREQAVQQAMGACLKQNGYTVVRWRTPTQAEIEAGAITTPTAPHVVQPAGEP
jgi:hypothetical protein